MGAAKIMVILNAEKPITGRAAGVRARGDEDDASPITRGCMCSPSDSTWVWRAVNAGDVDGAVNLMEGLRGRHTPEIALSAVAEQLLLDAGRAPPGQDSWHP